MTNINDISDLVQILQDHPQWRQTVRGIILGEELAQVPQQLAAFIEATQQNFQAVDRRFEAMDQRLNAFIEATQQNFQLVNRQFELLNTRMERVETDVAELQTNVADLRTDMNQRFNRIDDQFNQVDDRFNRIDDQFNEVDQRFNQIDDRFNRVEGRMDNGFGTNYEYKVVNNVGSIAGQHLHLRRTMVLKGIGITRDPTLAELVEQAEDQGLITEEQNNELWWLDLIFSGRRRPDNASIHVAAEISITVGDDDITRVAERARTLETTLNGPVTPVVIGTRIDEPQTALATASNVTVILVPEN